MQLKHSQAHAMLLLQVVVRVRPVLPHENPHDVAVSCSEDGAKVQVRVRQLVTQPGVLYCYTATCAVTAQQPTSSTRVLGFRARCCEL